MSTPPAIDRLLPGLRLVALTALLAGTPLLGLAVAVRADDLSSELPIYSLAVHSAPAAAAVLPFPVVVRSEAAALPNPAARPARSTSSAALAGPADLEASLSGQAIYQRVLDNTYDSFIQTSSLYSGDRGGNEQWSRFKIWFQNERVAGVEPSKGDVIARSRVQYTEPYEIRHAGYLVLARRDRTNDQFVYMPSQRRVKRVNLRGEAVFGSDFSFEDILPREIEDAEYRRLADVETLGRACFVVEAIPEQSARSEYSRMVVHIDKERSLPLLTRYWNARKIEVKELKADPDSVELIEDVWVARRMTMRHLKLETYTRLELASLQANPPLSDKTFELRQLEAHGR